MRLCQIKSSKKGGFSLVEIFAALAIFSVILVVLSLTLDLSLKALRKQASISTVESDIKSAIQSIEADWEGVVVDRPSSFSFGQRLFLSRAKFFDRKRFMPVEVNRSEGADMNHSFAQADSEFSSMLFATAVSTSRYHHPLREQIRFSKGGIDISDFNQSIEAIGEVGLCGYYVAYTKNSNEPDSGISPKLFRHFRSGGITYGNGHANGVLAYCSDVFNPVSERTVLRGSDWNNASLPNILAKRYTAPGSTEVASVIQPWPLFGTFGLPEMTTPPAFDQAAWLEPDHVIHDFVFGDEPIVKNVVEFDCVPYKKVETSPGVFELYNSEDLNRYLGLYNSDWPILVKPDIIDIHLGVLSEDVARLLKDRSDWGMPNFEVPISQLSSVERIKRQQMQRFFFRVHID